MNKVLNRALSVLSSACQKSQQRLSSSYKAAVLIKPGEPLQIQERKQEKLKSNQFKTGDPHLPFVPGYELAGNVVEVGKDISKEKVMVGDRVAGLNVENFGGFAEECILDSCDIWRIPSEVERKDAAVLAYGHSTALYALSKLSTIKEKEQIVITVGPAGMGLAAVDVAANVYGANVIGVIDNEKLGDLVREKGAFKTIAFDSKLQKYILKETNNKGVKIVYDAVGEHMMKTIGTCTALNGKIFHAAPFFYESVPPPTPHSFLSIVSLKYLRKQSLDLYKTVVADTLELANEGIISAHVSAKFELEDINKAIEFIDNKKCTGKVLIHID